MCKCTDIEVGTVETFYTIEDLLGQVDNAMREKNRAATLSALRRACASNRGRLKYSAYLMEHHVEDMSPAQRIAEIEKLLFYVENTGDAEEMKKACSMLADFYSRLKDRPLRSLGFMLRSFRVGAEINAYLLGTLRRKITAIEVSQLEEDPFGSYLCGFECSFFNSDSLRMWSRRFLGIAAESGTVPWAGLAAMHMASLLESETPQNDQEIGYWKKIASSCGNSDLLTK